MSTRGWSASPLEDSLNFWRPIYTSYTSEQGVIHDTKYLDIIYEVIDFTEKKQLSKTNYIQLRRNYWKSILLSLHEKMLSSQELNECFLSTFSQDERKVYHLFKDKILSQEGDYSIFLQAAHRKRIRFQLGQKNLFMQGVKNSGLYLSHIELIFEEKEMPQFLTRLPYVESYFNYKAFSKVGASGIWQFMRSTAQLFIQVDDMIDERNDPLFATHAAAKLLKLNKESLGNWPLAITAYNHGRKSLLRGTRQVGSSNWEDLIKNFKARSFGFASRNFYPQLLETVEIDQKYKSFFPLLEKFEPIQFTEIIWENPIQMTQEIKKRNWNLSTLERIKELNPALDKNIWNGKNKFPKKYPLRVPVF